MVGTQASLVPQFMRRIPPRRGWWGFVSSRTPEGRFGRCPVCRKHVCIEPSAPYGDAPCPRCGHLIWSIDPLWPERTLRGAPSGQRLGAAAPAAFSIHTAIRRMARLARHVAPRLAPARKPRRTPTEAACSSPGVWDAWLDG